MTTSGLITVVLVGLIALRLTSRAGQAGPTPTLDSVAPPTKLDHAQLEGQVAALVTTSSSHSTVGQLNNQKPSADYSPPTLSLAGKTGAGLGKVSPGKTSYQVPTRSQQASAEKLRRGLTNFMNNLNPAPFFVPQLQPNQLGGKIKALSAAQSGALQAEPATIINEGPSADVLIKGPNRLVQSRPLGGPPRWGRR